MLQNAEIHTTRSSFLYVMAVYRIFQALKLKKINNYNLNDMQINIFQIK